MKHADPQLWNETNKVLSSPRNTGRGHIGNLDGNKVHIVDGNEVKLSQPHDGDDADPMDFVEGGNDLEAKHIKRDYGANSLLVDGRLDSNDHPYVLYHEAHERRLMAKGHSYARAHASANKAELELRKLNRKRK